MSLKSQEMNSNSGQRTCFEISSAQVRHQPRDRAVVVERRLAETDAIHGHEIVATSNVHADEHCAPLVHAPRRERAFDHSHRLDVYRVRESELPADLSRTERDIAYAN